MYFKATLAKRIMGFPPFGVSADVTLQDLTKIGYLVVSLPSDVVTYHIKLNIAHLWINTFQLYSSKLFKIFVKNKKERHYCIFVLLDLF